MEEKAQPVQTIERVAALAMHLVPATWPTTWQPAGHDFYPAPVDGLLDFARLYQNPYRGLLELLAISPSLRQ